MYFKNTGTGNAQFARKHIQTKRRNKTMEWLLWEEENGHEERRHVETNHVLTYCIIHLYLLSIFFTILSFMRVRTFIAS